MDKDATPVYLGVAVTLLAVYFQFQLTVVRQQLNTCKSEFQGFKDGVIYGNVK